MKSFLIRSTVLSSLVLLICATFLGFVYCSTQTEPAFYRDALTVDVVEQAAAGEELEIEALELHNQIVSRDQWEATFTDEQINGWLAVDLPTKFPTSLPDSVGKPRLKVSDGKVVLACWYRGSQFQGVVQLECEPFLTSSPNEIGLKVCRLQTGLVPLPMNQWLEDVSREAAKLGYPVRWSQDGGDPVALIQLPLHEISTERVLTVEHLALEEGRLQISGSSRPVEAETSPPTQVAEHHDESSDQPIHQ